MRGGRVEERWAKLEEIVRRVVREELSTFSPQKSKLKIGFVNGQFTGLGEREFFALGEAFPAVDVKKEMKEMAAWILLNPSDAPRSNYGAFVNTWLRRNQDRSAIRSIPTKNDLLQDTKKFCAYCSKPTVGSVNGIWHCAAHSHDAMDRVPAVKSA